MTSANADSIRRMAAFQDMIHSESSKSATAAKASTEKTCIRTGRGSVAGWTICPLCHQHPHKQKHQVRRYALGRGIASHLHAIHTPWLCQKSKKRQISATVKTNQEQQQPQSSSPTNNCELGYLSHQPNKRQKRELEPLCSTSVTSEAVEDLTEVQQKYQPLSNDNKNSEFLWTPTPMEIEEWNTKVLQIVKNLEIKVQSVHHPPTSIPSPDEHQIRNGLMLNKSSAIDVDTTLPSSNVLPPGYDRNGRSLTSSSCVPPSSYQATLPSFIKAAAAGNLQQLKNMIEQRESGVDTDGNHESKQEIKKQRTVVLKLINTRDKHGSIAEHWAAGGGHLKCLQFLIQLRRQYDSEAGEASTTRRRRDGKTCLHYAARNGHLECIKYIIDEKIYTVDVKSNDGTTPLHMACYGGQIDTMWYLIEHCHANVHQMNDYGCAMVHWIGLSPFLNDNVDHSHRVVELLSKLCNVYGISLFLMTQKHGHTILHKAAQKLNQPIIEYFLHMNHLSPQQIALIGGIPDTNGHTVSTIWRSFGGSEAFAQRIEQERNW